MLRSINRMNELVASARVEGEILYNGMNILDSSIDPVMVRSQIGMVFQKPNPFPKSIYDNVSWGAKANGFRGDLDELVENSLQQAALWDEVKDNLDESGLSLSGGQQQRLCIARTIAVNPEVILMDEPASALDVGGTRAIEELMFELRSRYTIVIVTHNMSQATRCSDMTAFMYLGKLIEYGPTMDVFERPKDPQTEAYVTGTFG